MTITKLENNSEIIWVMPRVQGWVGYTLTGGLFKCSGFNLLNTV
jgi:hypothetical protein